MDEKGLAVSVTTLLIIGSVLAVGYTGWYSWWKGDPANRTEPPFAEKITEASGEELRNYVKIRMDIKIKVEEWSGWSGFLEDDTTVEILRNTIDRDTYKAPQWFWDDQPDSGELLVKVKDDSRLVDDWGRHFEINEGYLPGGEGVFSTKWFEVGLEGSGSYTIKAIIKSDTGEVLDTDETTVTI